MFGRICSCCDGAVEHPPVPSTPLSTATQTIEAFIHLPQTTAGILSLLAINSLYQFATFIGFDRTPARLNDCPGAMRRSESDDEIAKLFLCDIMN